MRIGIVGLGNIGAGLARAFRGSHELMVLGRRPEQTALIAKECGGRVANDLKQLAEASEVIFVSVKPHDLPALGRELSSHLTKRHLVVSVAAGVGSEKLRKWFPQAQVIRLMPNIALEVGQAVMAIEDDPELDQQVKATITKLIAPTGSVVWLAAPLIEAVGALSGSGLAFLMVVLEAMTEAGITMGLPSKQAQMIAAQTMSGAAELVKREEGALSDLRWRVTSPGGTTVAGLRALEERGARSAIIEAVLAAHQRACESEND